MRKYTKSNNKRIEWYLAPDVKKRVLALLDTLQIDWVKKGRIVCFRSQNANTRAYARIWGLAKIWQMALKTTPAYIIEVISEKYDDLIDIEKDKVLLHELNHVPKNFSGALIPHIRHGKRKFSSRVDELIFQYLRTKS